MKINLSSISETFDAYCDSWDNIEINLSKDGTSCYINRKTGKNFFIKEIKLSNNPQVNTYCSWAFYESSRTRKFTPRPTFYKKTKQNEIKNTNSSKVIISLDDKDLPIKFWEMISFIYGYKNLIDIGNFEENYSVADKNKFIAEFNTYNDIEQINTLKEFIKDKNLSYNSLNELLETSKRNSLQQFKHLLNNPEKSEKEAVWQLFFEENQWIFAGLSLKLIFINDLISQAHIGLTDTSGKGAPISDFIALSDYVTLVEIKTPNSSIFTERKNNTARANTWSFSPELIDGVSQCLAQKSAWLESVNKPLVAGSKILSRDIHRTEDPKVIFIIGNKSREFPNASTNIDDRKKADTFERFRQNNKNIDIVTYDELFERASFIVNGKIIGDNNTNELPKEFNECPF